MKDIRPIKCAYLRILQDQIHSFDNAVKMFWTIRLKREPSSPEHFHRCSSYS